MNRLRQFYPVGVRVVFKPQPRAYRRDRLPAARMALQHDGDWAVVSDEGDDGLFAGRVVEVDASKPRPFGALGEIFVPLVVVEARLDAGAQEQSSKDFAPDSRVNTPERVENFIRRRERFARRAGGRPRNTDVCRSRP